MEEKKEIRPWEVFASKLGSWAEKFKPFYEAGGFEPIYDYLQSRRPLGYKVVPLPEDTFRIFQEVSYDNLKAIFWLQD